MSPTLKAHFADYSAFHGTPGNQACHYVGIPLIVLTVFSMLAKVPLADVGGFTLTLAEVLIAAVTVYYLTMDPPLALAMLASSVVLDAVGRRIPFWLAFAVFVFGWALQFV